VRTVAITTLGCKVNQYDSEAIAAQFRKAGFEVVPFEDVADVYVINTCTVTQMGDKKSRQFIRRAHSRNPDALIVAAGCYAQASPSEVAALPGVCVVSGTYERGRIVQAVLNFERSSRPCRLDVDGAEADRTGLEQRSVAPEVLVRETRSFGAFEELPAEGWAERTRAYVKIEDGCENFCSYCKVPYVRGPVRSRDPLRICREIELLASLGYREVVLTGIDLGAYGRDFGGSPDLAEILEAAAKVEGIARVRLSSVDPTDGTIDLSPTTVASSLKSGVLSLLLINAVLALSSSAKPSLGPRTTFSVEGSSIPRCSHPFASKSTHSRLPSTNRAPSPLSTCSMTNSMLPTTAIWPDGIRCVETMVAMLSRSSTPASRAGVLSASITDLSAIMFITSREVKPSM
jgi:hypothetical protein